MKRKTLLGGAAVLALTLGLAAGCSKDKGAGGGAGLPLQEIVPGLSYVDSVQGNGPEVQPDDFVQIHYSGWLYENGQKTTKFDSSVDRGEPISFPLGRSFVIQGWEKGVPGMHVGGKRTLLISPDLAFGAQGRPPVIPPNATLIFDVEAVDVPTLHKEILSAGQGAAAEPGDQVSVHYTGWLYENGQKGQMFDSSLTRGQPYNFTLGAGMVIPGWDLGLEGMTVGTKAQLIVPPAMGYGARGYGQTIPPNATLCFEVELVSIDGK